MTFKKQGLCMNKNKYFCVVSISGILSALSFYSSSLWYIIFFSISPVFYTIIKYKCNIGLILFKFAFIFYLISDIWILSIGTNYFANKYLGIFFSFLLLLIISLILSFIFILPFVIYKSKNEKIFIKIINISFLFIFGEWLQGQFIPFAFPWNRLCNIVVNDIKFIQSASIFGGLFITLLILLINFMFALFWVYHSKKSLKSILFIIAAFFIYLSNSFIGEIIIKNTQNNAEPQKVLLVQGNFSKKEKWNSQPEEIMDRYLELTNENLKEDIKLVVYPETALSGSIFEDKNFKQKLYDFCNENNITILFGAQYNDENLRYNACAAAYPEKKYSEIYFKQILVPFGEYNPFFSNSNFQFISNSFSKGNKSVLIETDIGKLGCGICFESIFPKLISENSKCGAEAIVILTNDSWLGKSIPLYQHHSHSILRAVENKKYIINCTNTGISSVISSNGEVIEKSKINCTDTISAEIFTNNTNTFYTLYGDIIILPSCIIIIFISIRLIYKNIYEIILIIKVKLFKR